ncbi:hypothetical protein KG892_02560 [Vermiphilus pyriformis]|nr:MAG: hypothetical protein KG892_02560 [Vermiphilus pyriformis]
MKNYRLLMLAFLAGISSNIHAFEYLTKREQISLSHMHPNLIRNVYQEHAKIIYAASATAIVLGLGWWLYVACIKGNNTTGSDQDSAQSDISKTGEVGNPDISPSISANASGAQQRNFTHKKGASISMPPDANITNKKGGCVPRSELHQDSSHSASTDTSGEPSDDEQYDSTKRDSQAFDNPRVTENQSEKNKEFAPGLKSEDLLPSPAEPSSLDGKPQNMPFNQNLSVEEDDRSELTVGTLFPLDGSDVNQDVTSEDNSFLNVSNHKVSDEQLDTTLDDATIFDISKPQDCSTPHKKQHENDDNNISKQQSYSSQTIENNIYHSVLSDHSSDYATPNSSIESIDSQEYETGSAGTESFLPSSADSFKSAISNESSASDHIVEKSAAISQGSQRPKKLITQASLDDTIAKFNSFHVTTPKKSKRSSGDMTSDKSTSGSGYDSCKSEEFTNDSSNGSIDVPLEVLSEDDFEELSRDAQKIEQQSAEELKKFEDAQRKLRNRPSLDYMLGYDSVNATFSDFIRAVPIKEVNDFDAVEVVSSVIGMYKNHLYCCSQQDHSVPELEYIIDNQEFIKESDACFFAKECAKEYAHEKVNCDRGAEGPLKKRFAKWFILYDFSGYKNKDAIEKLREKYKAAIEYYINRS